MNERLHRWGRGRPLQWLWRSALLALLCLFALPTLAQSDQVDESKVITLTTTRQVGEKIRLGIVADGSVRIEGVQEAYEKTDDYYKEYTLSAQEVKVYGSVTEFSCWGNRLSALDVSQNVVLQRLSCSGNRLTSLDVSQNAALQTLSCGTNQLTTLDVSKNVALQKLQCQYNQLTILDVSKNEMLRELQCQYNQLTILDVSKNEALQVLDCFNNQLTNLDLSRNQQLKDLGIFGNKIGYEAMATLVDQLPTLDASSLGEDDGYFYVVDKMQANEGNRMSTASATLAKNKGWRVRDYNNGKDANGEWNGLGIPYSGEDEPVVEQVDERYVITLQTRKQVGDKIRLGIVANGAVRIEGVQEAYEKTDDYYKEYTLTAQEVKVYGEVTRFDCQNNSLSALDVSQNEALQWLNCRINQLTSLDVSKSVGLQGLYCDNNQLTSLDVSKSVGLQSLYCDNNQLTSLDVRGSSALQWLFCSNNQLTSLDVRGNVALQWLSCFNNQLTALDVSKNELLQRLYCYNNQLTSLDVRGNVALQWLYCSNNQLTSLDVRGSSALQWLSCSNNQLTSLDLSHNQQLKSLSIYGNKIGYEAMATLVGQLPTLDVNSLGEYEGYFYVVDKKNPNEGNRLSTELATLAKNKGWKVRDYNNGEDADGQGNWRGIEYDGEDEPVVEQVDERYVITLQTRKQVGEVVTLRVKTESPVRVEGVEAVVQPRAGVWQAVDVRLTSSTIRIYGRLQGLDCREAQIESLVISPVSSAQRGSALFSRATSGTEAHSIEWLDCSHNALTSLDLTSATNLSHLDASYNALSSVEIPEGNSLSHVEVQVNRLGKEAMASIVSSLPDQSNALIIVVDKTNPREGNHIDRQSVGTAKGKGWQINDANNQTDEGGNPSDTGIPYEGESSVYAVTLEQSDGGLITIEGKTEQELQAIEEGTELSVTATPAEGYELSALTANGSDIMATKRFTLDGNTTVRATFRKRTYSVTTNTPEHGAIRITGASDLQAVPHGTTLSVEISPEAGYELATLTANGTDISTTRQFVVTSDTRAEATFREKPVVVKKYAVTLESTDGGKIRIKGKTAEELQAVEEGTELSVSIAREEGYTLASLTANGVDIMGTKKFVVTSDTRVVGTFEKRTFAIKLPTVDHATVQVKGNPDLSKVVYGTELELEITPEEGYEVAEVKVNGKTLTPPYRFRVDGTPVIVVKMKRSTYHILQFVEGKGALSITGASDLQAVPHGTQLSVTATPEQGYELATLTANGTDISTTRQFVVTSDTRVEATFREKPVVVKKYAVTLESTDGGKIRIKGKTAEELKAVEEGTELSVSIAREEGYTLASLTANGVDIMSAKKFVVTSDTRVVATFEKRTFAVKLPTVEHATVQVKGNPDLSKVVYGTELELEITPEEGYEVAEVKVNGKTLTPPYRFRVDGTPVIVVKMKRSTYHILQFVEGKGALSITGASDLQAVPHGTQLSVTATPEQGYELAALTANGTDISTTRQFVVTSDTRVEATFREKPVVVKKYAVTLESTDGGKIRIKGKTAEELKAVEEGTELSVSIAREEGYTLASLTANGVDIMDTKKFVVTSDTRVVGTFEKRTFAIKLPEVEHATVRVKGNPDLSKVVYGTELELEITPDEEYVVEEVKVNGKTLTPPYRFRVEGEVTISIKMRKTNAVSEVGQTSIRLYPNPATSYIVVEGVEEGEPLRLINLVGRVVLEQAQSASGRLSVSHLDRGVYLLQVQGTTHRVVLR